MTPRDRVTQNQENERSGGEGAVSSDGLSACPRNGFGDAIDPEVPVRRDGKNTRQLIWRKIERLAVETNQPRSSSLEC